MGPGPSALIAQNQRSQHERVHADAALRATPNATKVSATVSLAGAHDDFMLQKLTQHTSRNAYLMLVLTMLLWAGNHVVGRWAAGHIPPMTLAFLRWAVAALLILPLAWPSLKADGPAIRANLPILMLLGLLGSGCYNTLQYIALTQTTVANAAILNSWAPVLIAAAGAVLFGDRLSRRQIGGIALSMLGVLVIILHGRIETLTALAFNRGDLVMVVATLAWATYTTLLRFRPGVSTLSFAAITYGVAGIVNAPLAVFEFANGQRIIPSLAVAGAIAYAALLASLVAYFLYARAVEIIGGVRTGVFIHLIPLFASLLGLVFLGEAPALYHAVGFGLILTGVWVASAAGR